MKMTIICLDKEDSEAYDTMKSLAEIFSLKYDVNFTDKFEDIEDDGMVLISSPVVDEALLSTIKNLKKATTTYYLHDRLAYNQLKTDKTIKEYIDVCDYVFTFIPGFLKDKMNVDRNKICAANSLSYALLPKEMCDERSFLYNERQANFIDLRKSSENPEYDSAELDHQILSAIFKGIVPILPARFKNNIILSGEDFDKMTLIFDESKKLEEQMSAFNILDARKQMWQFIDLLLDRQIFLSGIELSLIHNNTFNFVKGMAEAVPAEI